MLYFKEKDFDIYDFGTYMDGAEFQGLNKFELSFGGEKLRSSNYFSPTCMHYIP
ncbi:hypothetical protein [Solitalea lacus]|uniref:hypothetical protein n=1 Tax=Solitalea lacus TaxID=2911172 RepID=UPI001EDBD801|nr:hypothetical protein [Solitalea lacus]UKJ08811.1 hypothetical protein L2B55_06495 [Solitalea lacus]